MEEMSLHRLAVDWRQSAALVSKWTPHTPSSSASNSSSTWRQSPPANTQVLPLYYNLVCSLTSGVPREQQVLVVGEVGRELTSQVGPPLASMGKILTWQPDTGNM